MRIVIVMDRNVRDYTALPQTFARALRNIGYSVETVFFEVPIRVFRIIDTFFPFLNRLFLAGQQEAVIRKVEESDCQLVLVVKGFFLLDTTIDALKSKGKTVVCYNPDDPFNPKFGSANRVIRSAVKNFDHYFIWSHRLIEPIEKLGCEHVHYLPFAVDDGLIKPAPIGNGAVEQNMDVSFIGGADEKRINLVTSLRKLVHDDVEISLFGNDWPSIPGVKVHSAIYGDEYLDVMYRSKINLNILRVQNEDANNMRTFEIPATRCFMLHEYSREATGFFKEGVEAVYYRNVGECAEKIVEHLKNDAHRLEIAEAGYEKVYKAGYLYENLMQELLDKIDPSKT